MIDFRYHVVSLVAVLLALATGILVGSSLLNQSLIDSQRATISSFAGEKDALREELALAQGQVTYRDNYLGSLRSTLLPSRLLGQRVSLVLLPGSDAEIADELSKTLVEAGAQVANRIAVTSDFFDEPGPDKPEEKEDDGEDAGSGSSDKPAVETDKAAERDVLVRRYALPAVKSKDADAQLAGALMSKVPGATLDAAANTLLGQLDKAGFIQRDASPDRGDVAVLIAAAPPEEPKDEFNRNRAGAVELAAAMDAAGRGTVVAGPVESAAGGAIESVRKSAKTSSDVSTVDSVDSPFGLVAVAYALVEQLAGASGQYGAGDAADSALPQFRSVPSTGGKKK